MANGFFPAQVDSVAAIIRRLAYWLLISEKDEQWNALMGEASGAPDTSKAPQADQRQRRAVCCTGEVHGVRQRTP